MAIKVAGITKEELDQNVLYVVKFTGHRDVGTYPDLQERYGEDFFSRDDVVM